MKIRFKGNTSKIKKFFPATEDKPATLYVDVAEKIKNRDGSETTIWHKVRVYRGYAEAVYKGLHGENPVSRYIEVEGDIVTAPKSTVGNDGKLVTYNVIRASEITYLDNKWPEGQPALPEDTADENLEEAEPVEAPAPEGEDEDCPW